jgi:hypothetical protein
VLIDVEMLVGVEMLLMELLTEKSLTRS